VSLLLAAACVGGGVFVARWIARTMNRNAPSPPDATAMERAPASRPKGDSLASFPFRIGDVVVRGGRDEAWLSGALVFSEDAPTLALFIAPEAGGDRAILARARPSTSVLWLEALPRGALEIGREPPGALEIDGTRFERIRRLPFTVSRVGSGAPDVGESAILGEYTSEAGDRLLAILGASTTLTWRGVELGDGMYEVLGSSPPE
jgi:hypothetical protein